jgi:hypothetical protein
MAEVLDVDGVVMMIVWWLKVPEGHGERFGCPVWMLG